VDLAPKEAVYYSNRAAAYTKSGKLDEAIADADQAIALKPGWAKGYSRKAAAEQLKGKKDSALTTYEQGLKAVEDKDGRTALQGQLMEMVKEVAKDEKSAAGMFGPQKPMKKQQPNKARLTLCIMASMILGPVTSHFVQYGPALLYSVAWCLLFAVTGVLIKPEETVVEPQSQGWWYKLRPYIFPALYWNQDKNLKTA